MPYTIKKVDVWAGEIADRPGGLADKLSALSDAGANFEFLISRRAPDKPGTGVVFLAPIKGAKQKGAAQAGLEVGHEVAESEMGFETKRMARRLEACLPFNSCRPCHKRLGGQAEDLEHRGHRR